MVGACGSGGIALEQAFARLCGKRLGHVVVTPNMMCAEGSESQTFRTLELLLTSIHEGERPAQNHSAL